MPWLCTDKRDNAIFLFIWAKIFQILIFHFRLITKAVDIEYCLGFENQPVQSVRDRQAVKLPKDSLNCSEW